MVSHLRDALLLPSLVFWRLDCPVPAPSGAIALRLPALAEYLLQMRCSSLFSATLPHTPWSRPPHFRWHPWPSRPAGVVAFTRYSLPSPHVAWCASTLSCRGLQQHVYPYWCVCCSGVRVCVCGLNRHY